MSCCSKKRMELTRQLNSIKKRKEKQSLITQNKIYTTFRYIGNKPWIYKGAYSHTRYHFKQEGDILTLHPQDIAAAMGEPLLENAP